jgi:hypothetical protein
MTEHTIKTTADRQSVAEEILSLPDGQKWLVKILKFDEAKTAAQNRCMWMWNREIGAYYGYTEDEMHEYFKERYLIRIKMETSDNFVALVEMLNEHDPESERYKKVARAIAAEITTTNLRSKPTAMYLTRIKFFAIHENIPITIPKKDEHDWLLGITRKRPKRLTI